MLSKILDGNKISKKIIQKIKKEVKYENRFRKRPPGLAVIWINNNISSKIYIKKKTIACNAVGFYTEEWKLKSSIKEQDILILIKKLNNEEKIDGILIQLPLPSHINTQKVIESIHPKKDVDGFHPYNIGCLCQKKPKLRPCTPKGIMTLFKEYHLSIQGLNATVIGASNIVGRPMALELLLSGCTTTIVHRFTKNLKQHLQNADLIIIAIGKANFLHNKNIKKGTIIVDVGINRIEKTNTIVGDVDFESVYSHVSYITPVPGGVGPMTVATLLQNTVAGYKKKYTYDENI
ncbi:bifunctional methylenetetrahydrofolate dehydrogenase/methenyltetrahydrofolate cyclohydrolase FolD [Buchnera aphidicola]|uniref:bifunctional methylenetetrahydrofolate dehydrogenase/methenyltetrahydrofolate cyclohydrolase FolD n=1 Tax=Buchnera aphidicola TaxID=9 RepID=UPI003463FED2